MGLMSEWKAFASLAIDTLGMPVDAMPFYDRSFKLKGEKILELVLKTGNLGHNNDINYRRKYPAVVVNALTLWRRIYDFAKLARLFPVDSPRFFGRYVLNRITRE